ncbi:MAG: MarR family winged helix-turn-helix transcriptional regulator [Zoogloeaceae bacterium]|jgi:DNA-binding MarR family transcriptional regulator|nr:MarR family winged helix-turn-helix transcriptional regulator [Zoogloeaceae bacterium]
MPKTPTPPTPIDVLKQFRGIFNSVKRHFQQTESVSRISGTQMWGLSIVAHHPGIRISDLANLMGIHQSTCSNLIDQLCRQQFTLKQRSDSDQRVVRLYPTERGLQLLGETPHPVAGILPSALQQLSREDLTRLHLILEKLIQTMQQRDPSIVESTKTPMAEIVTPIPPRPKQVATC